MSAKEKLRCKIENGPRNVRLNELIKLMGYYGFSHTQTKHGFLFRHDELLCRIIVPIPHGREKKVHKCYVDECLIAIAQLEEIERQGR